MENAPYFQDLAGGPPPDRCRYVSAADGTRLRVALWAGGKRGTVCILQGRAEFAEKYALVIGRLLDAGFSAATADWRGQGLSQRPDTARNIGHVDDFADYQQDLAALGRAAEEASMPGPTIMLAHSTGGTIGLRALIAGFPATAAVFSAPLWGLTLPRATEVLARSVIRAAPATALRFAPGAGDTPYALTMGFAGNLLTGDRTHFERLRRMLRERPELGLGGPSLGWLAAALRETAALRVANLPATPVLALLGAREHVVSAAAVREVVARLPDGELMEIPGARHEVLIERPAVQREAWSRIAAFLDRAAPAGG